MSGLFTKIAHNNRVSLGPKDTRELADLIGSEKKVVETTNRLSGDRTKSSAALKEWGVAEGPDLSDILSKVSILFDYLSSAENAFAEHSSNFRIHFKSIRTREENFATLKRNQSSLTGKIENQERKVSKMKEENKDLPAAAQRLSEMRQEMVGLDHSVMNEEARLCDFKRSVTREALSLKLGALLELGEKTTIIAEVGKLIADEIPRERTAPGEPRATYHGYERTDELMHEAQRCIQDVVFNPTPLASGGHDQQQYNDGDGEGGYDPDNPEGHDHSVEARERQQAEREMSEGPQNEWSGVSSGVGSGAAVAGAAGLAQGYGHGNGGSGHGGYSYSNAAYPNNHQVEPLGGELPSTYVDYANEPSPQVLHRDFGATASEQIPRSRNVSGNSQMVLPNIQTSAPLQKTDVIPPSPSYPRDGGNSIRLVNDGGLAPPKLTPGDRSSLAYMDAAEELPTAGTPQQHVTPRVSLESQRQQDFRQAHPQQHYTDPGLQSPPTQYQKVQADATPYVGGMSSPMPAQHNAGYGSFTPNQQQQQPSSYYGAGRGIAQREQRPYVPKAGDGAYHGQPTGVPPPPTLAQQRGVPPVKSQLQSSSGYNVKDNFASPPTNPAEESPLPENTAAATPPSDWNSNKKPALPRGESALGSKHGDIFVPGRPTEPVNSIPVVNPNVAAGTPGASFLGTGYFRGGDATSTGSSGAGRVTAGAFGRRNGPATPGFGQGIGQYQLPLPLSLGSDRERYGSAAQQVPGGPSQADAIRDKYLASTRIAPLTPEDSQPLSATGNQSVDGASAAPRFDTSPLKVDKTSNRNSVQMDPTTGSNSGDWAHAGPGHTLGSTFREGGSSVVGGGQPPPAYPQTGLESSGGGLPQTGSAAGPIYTSAPSTPGTGGGGAGFGSSNFVTRLD